jgi:hypothetical protein
MELCLKASLFIDQREYFNQRHILVNRTPPAVLQRARQVIERLEQGVPYWRLRGKRLRCNRELISIPVGRKWRILAIDCSGRIVPAEVLSHARYNDLSTTAS